MSGLTFQIYKGEQLVKTLTAKGMNSIYSQYKKYCFNRHASVQVECEQSVSFGLLYWTNYTDNFYLKQSQDSK